MSRADLIPYGILLLRFALGVLFLAHGLLKLLVFKPAGTAGYFRSLGLPGVVGYLTMAAEIGGGTFLILGVATSLVAIVLVPLVLGTIVMAVRLRRSSRQCSLSQHCHSHSRTPDPAREAHGPAACGCQAP
jgi:uncharacterized membrane protein YphA (DoxX/SURF4 family)